VQFTFILIIRKSPPVSSLSSLSEELLPLASLPRGIVPIVTVTTTSTTATNSPPDVTNTGIQILFYHRRSITYHFRYSLISSPFLRPLESNSSHSYPKMLSLTKASSRRRFSNILRTREYQKDVEYRRRCLKRYGLGDEGKNGD
jgi:hypothetical protein